MKKSQFALGFPLKNKIAKTNWLNFVPLLNETGMRSFKTSLIQVSLVPK